MMMPMAEGGRTQGEHDSMRRPLWSMTLLFVLTVALLQWGWSAARGTVIEHAVIDVATVGVAVSVINTLTPAVRASAAGSRIRARGASINVLNGCEGTEVLFLFLAALLSYPLSWRTRAAGLLAGAGIIFVANQVRLVTLFYSFLRNRALFEALHGLLMPMFLIALSVGLFAGLMHWDTRIRARGRAC